MTTVSAVTICSNALLQNGEEPIDNLSGDNNRTKLVVGLYEAKRDKVLRAHPWNCATKYVVLSPDTAAPAFDWSYQFTLPSDWLRTLSVGLKGCADDYRLVGRKIYMNKNICRLRYIWRNTAEATWDATLIEAMTQVMSVALTFPIVRSAAKEQLELQVLKDVLKQSRSIDAQENPPETFGDSPLLAHRVS